MTAAPTIADFILARVAEDEARWRRMADREGELPGYGLPRVLAECAAKRVIVEVCAPIGPASATDYVHGFRASGRAVLRHLAAVYSDHEDYNPEWRP